MSTPKEIFLELLRPDGQPERQLRQYEALSMCFTDPINAYLRGNRKRGSTSVDRWGTTISWPADAPGAMPVTENGMAVCPDVTRWREVVHAPDLGTNCAEGWDACRAAARVACGEEHLLAGFMGTGIFEQCHFLMGFENALTSLYEHPREMHELIEYITEYRLDYVRRLIDGLQPDVIFSHDDWGTKDALFMRPEMWREFFKEMCLHLAVGHLCSMRGSMSHKYKCGTIFLRCIQTVIACSLYCFCGKNFCNRLLICIDYRCICTYFTK